MKARKFWAIYVAVVALGLGIFYAAADSMEEVPFALSETEMQHIQGGEYNAKCTSKTGCPWSGCDPPGGTVYYTNRGNSWYDCTYSSTRMCYLSNRTVGVCDAVYHSMSRCRSPVGSGVVYEHGNCRTL